MTGQSISQPPPTRSLPPSRGPESCRPRNLDMSALPLRTTWTRTRLQLLGTLAIALGLAAGCQRDAGRGPPPKGPPEVKFAAAFERKIIDHEDFTGRLEAFKKVDVQARVAGYLQKVHFKGRAVVKEGQLLFEIDPRPYQADLDRAKAT